MSYLKTVIITGASKGIGQSIAELFAHKGYNVLINFNNSKKGELHCARCYSNRYAF
ncbi:SDR family NAD(P)-dependent oxidoreductase [Wukongibacter sp. M2B1]|uniref:SDR family NAD(P)-dependent oxidoreductase n=1 Tax=Wukongibacter sp. M2B1 TaxID=3088895 RepID=UPI003D798336